MTETPRFIPSKMAVDFRRADQDDDGTRPFVQPHYSQNDDGSLRAIYPARAMMLGHMLAEGNDDPVPIIKSDYAFGSTSLVYLPTAPELRMFGEEMLRIAERMEASAADLLARALAKRGDAA